MENVNDKRFEFISHQNSITDFSQVIDSIIDYWDGDNFDKYDKLSKEKIEYMNNEEPYNDVYKVEVIFGYEEYEGFDCTQKDYGFLFWLPTQELDLFHGIVYFPSIGIEKEGNFPMWISIIQLLENEEIKKIKIERI